MIADAPTLNSLWSRLLVAELVRCGCSYFCISPGSRSTPLTLAAAEHPGAQTAICLDERGSAYHALGYARATGRPATLICTSGTAVANFLPAVVEAAQDGVPMLLLTADRPPELRHTGANQTIDQVKIYGDFVRWQVDLPCPDRAIAPQFVLTTVDQAVYRAKASPAGPVHLNCMFREPLAPVGETSRFDDYLQPIQRWLRGKTPYTHYPPRRMLPGTPALDRVVHKINRARRGVLVLGMLASEEDRLAAAALAKVLRWPVFADVTSGLRLGESPAEHIPYFDQILCSEAFTRSHRPKMILHLGGRFVSKRLLQWLEAMPPAEYVMVERHPFRFDAAHRVSQRLEADIAVFCHAMLAEISGKSNPAWRQAWHAASERAGAAIGRALAAQEAASEPGVAQAISETILPGHGLFLANSMPVRDMDMFATAGAAAVRVAANRGASGIDGNIATAVGFAAGLGQPVTAVLGDLAFLHDLNALLQVKNSLVPLILVLINNDGGGIFSFLPVAEMREPFETFFGTPHGLTFAAAAELFGLDYHRPASMADFRRVYAAALQQPRSTVIEIRTERRENHRLHQELRAAVIAAVEGGA